MTNPEPSEELRAQLEAMQAPADIVPRAPLTKYDLAALNRAANSEVTMRIPGEVVEDPDGLPIGVSASREVAAELLQPVVHIADVEHIPLDIEGLRTRFPNINFYDPEEGNNNE